jgi:hypothetical protein
MYSRIRGHEDSTYVLMYVTHLVETGEEIYCGMTSERPEAWSQK